MKLKNKPFRKTLATVISGILICSGCHNPSTNYPQNKNIQNNYQDPNQKEIDPIDVGSKIGEMFYLFLPRAITGAPDKHRPFKYLKEENKKE